MQIAYELSERDFTEAYTAHRNSKTWWKVARIFVAIACLFTAVVLFGFLLKPSWESARALVPLFLVVPAWVALLWLLPRWSMRRQLRQQPGAQGPRTLIMDDTGAHWKWSGGSSDVEWKNYIRSVEGKNQILLYLSPVYFNILPKRVLAPEHLAELRELLTQHLQSKK